MRGLKIDISPVAVLILACAYYVLEPEMLAAALLPVAAHEAGHLMAMFFLGLRVRGFRFEPGGLCIDYCGYTGALGHAFLALSGPAAGFVYALQMVRIGHKTGISWLDASAGISLLLTVFNLLPALPLDGGRALEYTIYSFCGEHKGKAVCQTMSTLFGIMLLGAGSIMLVKGRGAAVIIAAVWLLYRQEGVVKRREIL